MKAMKKFIINKIKKLPYLRDVFNELDALKARLSLAKVPSIASLVSIDGGHTSYENLLPVSAYYSDNDIPPERWLHFDEVKLEKSLCEYIKHDTYPIPSTSDREGYFGPRHYHYWLSGLKDYLNIKHALRKHGRHVNDLSSVLDLGCASGRVLRHFSCQENNLDLWGADINSRHTEWIRRFLSPSLKIFQNTVLPHLPIEDNTFSLIYAFSVFTHIDEFEMAWIAEIRRILKEGGLAYLTIHSDNTWKNIKSAAPLYANLMAMKEYIHEYEVTPELFKMPMPAEKTVFKWASVSTYNTNVFHSISYINDVWGRFLEVVDVFKEGHNYQDVILLRKRS